MNYRRVFGAIVMFLLTINLSFTIGNSKPTSDKDELRQISIKYDINQYPSKWRRQPKLINSRADIVNKDKARPRTMTYDFLLHKWFLRKTRN